MTWRLLVLGYAKTGGYGTIAERALRRRKCNVPRLSYSWASTWKRGVGWIGPGNWFHWQRGPRYNASNFINFLRSLLSALYRHGKTTFPTPAHHRFPHSPFHALDSLRSSCSHPRSRSTMLGNSSCLAVCTMKSRKNDATMITKIVR